MSHRRMISPIALAALVGATLLLTSAGRSGVAGGAEIAAATQRRTVLSEVYTIDRKYRSMRGPSSGQGVRLSDAEPPELLWITGYAATMVGPDGVSPRAQDFMCHSNLDVDVAAHEALLGTSRAFSPRLFTLSQGQLEIRFPAGFGIPVMSNETLDLTTQVLNLNLVGREIEVRHKVELDYVRDRDVPGRMKALFPIAGYGLALLEGDHGYFGEPRPDAEVHGPGCLVGAAASPQDYADSLGRKFSGHWVVPPGREVNRTLVTHLMNVPYDTTIHTIAVHLHPFAESLELRDLTADKTLFKSTARNFEDRIGLAHVDGFSSEEGIAVFADHEYEMVSVYDNTTAEPQDSMAVMYLYLHDRKLDRRLAMGLAQRAGAD